MKLSVLANLYGSKPLDEALKIISSLGVHSVEIGAGGYPGKDHCDPEKLLADCVANRVASVGIGAVDKSRKYKGIVILSSGKDFVVNPAFFSFSVNSG